MFSGNGHVWICQLQSLGFLLLLFQMDSFSFTFPSFTTFLSISCLTVGERFTCKYASIVARLFSRVFGKENLSFLAALCFAVLFIKRVLPVYFCSASVFKVLSLILSLYLCIRILSFSLSKSNLLVCLCFLFLTASFVCLYDCICNSFVFCNGRRFDSFLVSFLLFLYHFIFSVIFVDEFSGFIILVYLKSEPIWENYERSPWAHLYFEWNCCAPAQFCYTI